MAPATQSGQGVLSAGPWVLPAKYRFHPGKPLELPDAPIKIRGPKDEVIDRAEALPRISARGGNRPAA